jgi:hypothetical protein
MDAVAPGARAADGRKRYLMTADYPHHPLRDHVARAARRQRDPEARRMAAKMRRKGDLDGADTWVNIIVAIGSCGTRLPAPRREARETEDKR